MRHPNCSKLKPKHAKFVLATDFTGH